MKSKKRRSNIYTLYIAVFMSIIILALTILGIIIVTIIDDFSNDLKKEELVKLNESFDEYISYYSLEKDEFVDFISNDNSDGMKQFMKITSINAPNSNLLIADSDGNIIMCIYEEGENVYVYRGNNIQDINMIGSLKISNEILSQISKDGHFSQIGNCDGVFTESVIFNCSSIDGENGEKLGNIISYYEGKHAADISKPIIKSITTMIILITIISLAAIYIISYLVINPLKKLSNAAKEFSRGNFNVRVNIVAPKDMKKVADSFNEMAIALSKKDEMQKNFLSNVSHDLRTPMTTIAGFIDGIIDGAIPKEKHEYYLNIIKIEIKRLNRLVSSLLDISRLQSGDYNFDKKPFNICELARQIIISLEKQFEEKNLDVEFKSDEFDMMAIGDSDAISRVIHNLCYNGIKFSYNNSKYIIKITKENSKIKFYVYNEGIGISDDEIPYIFDRFYKSDKSRGIDKSGVGLGLFISKKIIEAHDEKINVKSEYQKNCEFSFTLPIGE